MNLLGMASLPPAGSSAAAQAAAVQAQGARFDEMLEELKQKAAAAVKPPEGAAALEKEAAAAVDKERIQLEKRLREACEGFEAMLMGIMYKEMRSTVPKNELFGDDNAHSIWQSMLDTALMDEAAKTGGIGLAEILYKQLAPQVLAADDAGAGAPKKG